MFLNLNFFHKINCLNIWNDKLLTSQSGIRVSFFPHHYWRLSLGMPGQHSTNYSPPSSAFFTPQCPGSYHKGMCECVDKGTQNSKNIYTTSWNASNPFSPSHMHSSLLKELYKLVQVPRQRNTPAVTHLVLTWLVILDDQQPLAILILLRKQSYSHVKAH